MSSTTFSGPCNDFSISLNLNEAKVLEIQAFNAKANQLYSFALDKTYLLEHPQFFNLIQQPSQILSYFQTNFSSVVFNGGQLKFTLSGPNCASQQISILLFKEPGLKAIYQSLAQKQREIQKLKQKDIRQENKIDQIASILQSLSGKIDNLQQKDTAIFSEIQGLKKSDINIKQSLNISIEKLSARFSTFQKEQAKRNSQFESLINGLKQKDQKFDAQMKRLIQIDQKLTEDINKANEKILQNLAASNKRFNQICQHLKRLSTTDAKITAQLDRLIKEQEEDDYIDAWLTKRLGKLSQRFDKITSNVNKLQKKVDRSIKDQKESTKFNFDILNKSIQETNNRISTLNTSIRNEIHTLRRESQKKDDFIVLQLHQFKQREHEINQKLINRDLVFELQIQNLKVDFDKRISCLERKVDTQIDNLNGQISLSISLTKNLEKNTNKRLQELSNRATSLQNDLTKSIKDTNDSLRLQLSNKITDLSLKIDNFNTKFEKKDEATDGQIKKINDTIGCLTQELDRLLVQGNTIVEQLRNKDKAFDADIKEMREYNKCLEKLFETLSSKDFDIIRKINQLAARQERETKEMKDWVQCELLYLKNSLTKHIKDEVNTLNGKDKSLQVYINKQISTVNLLISNNTQQLKKIVTDQKNRVDVLITELRNKDQAILLAFEKQTEQFNNKDEELQLRIKTTNNQLNGEIRKLAKYVQNLQTAINQETGEIKKTVVAVKAFFSERITKLREELGKKIIQFAERFDAKDNKTDEEIKRIVDDCQKLSELINCLRVQGIDCLVELRNKDIFVEAEIKKINEAYLKFSLIIESLNIKDLTIFDKIEELAKRQQGQTQQMRQWVLTLLKNQKIQVSNNFSQEIQVVYKKIQETQVNITKNITANFDCKLDVKANKTELIQLKKEVSCLGNQILELEKRDKQQSRDITSIKDNVKKIDETIQKHTQQIQKLETGLSSRISILESIVKKKANSADLAQIKQRVCQLENNYLQLSQSFSEYNRQLKQKIDKKAENLSLLIQVNNIELLSRRLTTFDQYFKKEIKALKEKDKILNPSLGCGSFETFIAEWRQIDFRRKLGNHPQNKNSQKITTSSADFKYLEVYKGQDEDNTNFVNVYEVRPLQSVTYKLKFEQDAKIFIGVCTSDALGKEIQEKGLFGIKNNTEGHKGIDISVYNGEFIQFTVDLMENANFLKINRPQPNWFDRLIQIPKNMVGRGLYFEVASFSSIKFNLEVKS